MHVFFVLHLERCQWNSGSECTESHDLRRAVLTSELAQLDAATRSVEGRDQPHSVPRFELEVARLQANCP